MFKQNKWQAWYDAQPQHIKDWMNQPQAIWNDIDMIRSALVGAAIGLVVGIVIGYEWAWQPVVNTFKPLIG
jgi:polyferredoxin